MFLSLVALPNMNSLSVFDFGSRWCLPITKYDVRNCLKKTLCQYLGFPAQSVDDLDSELSDSREVIVCLCIPCMAQTPLQQPIKSHK
jgi:hypothetical protein